jgi:hypothetical protein
MRRWLLEQDDAVVEETAGQPTFGDEDLKCTPRGQVLLMDGTRSIFDLNRAEAARLAELRTSTWSELDDAGRRALVRKTAGIDIDPSRDRPAPQSKGFLERDGYRIEKLVLAPEPGIVLPMLRFVPEKPASRACLYLHGRGKHVDAAPGGAIERLVRDGAEVLAVDLRGCGETEMFPWRTGPAEVTGNNGTEFFVAYMLGESLVGMRAADTLAAAQFLAQREDGARRKLELIALDEAAIPALHAAAVEPALFSRVQLIRSIDSWQRVIDVEVSRRQLENVVHGALRHYDLADLVHLAGQDKVEFLEPIDATGEPMIR